MQIFTLTQTHNHAEFPEKNWTKLGLDMLLQKLQILAALTNGQAVDDGGQRRAGGENGAEPGRNTTESPFDETNFKGDWCASVVGLTYNS